VRRTLPERSIGHLGTLDPAAQGLLVLAVGRKALKVVELFMDLSKEYEADIHFGAVSTTYDREGVIEEQAPKPGWVIPDEMTLRRVLLDRFTGRIAQVPPAASAVKIAGERAYRKMRQGRGVLPPSRDVQIAECTILAYDYPNLRLGIRCGSGTYIRSLAHDLGIALRCGGYLAALTRTRVGEWTLESAVAPASARWTDVLPLKNVLRNVPAITITDDEAEDLRCGRNIEWEITGTTIAWHGELPVAILVPAGDGWAHARKVL
jgi:tRNA pseudouridine55 synthase